MTHIIEVNHLNLYYSNRLILDEVSFNIDENDFITIMGSNGSGKSLLAKVIIGLLPYKGSIKFQNQEISTLDSESIISNISLIMDDTDSLYIESTVVDELMGISNDSKLIKKVIAELNIQDLLDRDPRTLSIGEQQLINVACAILEQKKIIILDNALCMLDQYNKNRVLSLLKKMNTKGTIVVNLTQDSEDLLFSKRVIILNGNSIIIDESVKTAVTKEKEFYSARINLPFIAELCTKLKYYNIVSKIELDRIKLVSAIWK